MKTLRYWLLLGLFGGLPLAGGAAEFSRQAMLAAPIAVKDGVVSAGEGDGS